MARHAVFIGRGIGNGFSTDLHKSKSDHQTQCNQPEKTSFAGKQRTYRIPNLHKSELIT
jgi:hypothetical protein